MTNHRSASESGTTLVLVVLVLFALFGLAALTIDLALARLAHVQMQVAADAGALTGLALRDAAADPALSELARREAARDAVSIVFDDDFDGDPARLLDDALDLGAGPIVELTPGATDLRAARTLRVPAAFVYDPRPQLNVDNEEWGDIVAGRFEPEGERGESQAYERADFAVSSVDESPDASAMLLRLRRTRDAAGLDRVPGTSSSGPPLALLFGHASLVRPTPEASFDLRRDGLTVRATAIAAEGRARRIGVARDDLSLAGRAPFSLARSWWDALPAGTTRTLTLDPSGLLREGAQEAGRASSGGLALGERVIEEFALDPATLDLAYVPITIDVDGTAIVAGYGPVRFTTADGISLDVTRISALLAPVNASAVGPDGIAALAPDVRTLVLEAHAAIVDPLLAARIVR